MSIPTTITVTAPDLAAGAVEAGLLVRVARDLVADQVVRLDAVTPEGRRRLQAAADLVDAALRGEDVREQATGEFRAGILLGVDSVPVRLCIAGLVNLAVKLCVLRAYRDAGWPATLREAVGIFAQIEMTWGDLRREKERIEENLRFLAALDPSDRLTVRRSA